MKTAVIAQTNALTNARYSFSLYQKRFLYYIIKEVRRLYVETNEGNRTLFNNLYLTLKPEQLRECGSPSLVFKEAAQLRERTIYINREKEEVAVGWVNYVKRDKKTGMYEVEVSKEIMPELVDLAERYTTYSLTVALCLKSVYSQRLYEMCSQFKDYQDGYFFREIDTLHSLFDLPESYQNYWVLKARVLEPAQKEIKELYDTGECDLYFDFKEKDKKGKKVLSVAFRIVTRDREEARQCSPDDAVFFVRTQIAPKFKRDKKYIDRIVAAIQLNPDIALPIMAKLSEKLRNYSHREHAAIIRYVLNEDFNIT